MAVRHAMRALCKAACVLGLSGCGPAIVATAGAVTGMAVVQERSLKDSLTDTEIGLSINNGLLNESGELFRRVDVDVTEGRVVLTGGVEAPASSVRASEIAWSTPGVVSVDNEITVDQRASAERYGRDLWISSQVRARLLGDTNVMSLNYSIETHDGVVHLTGLARSEAELMRVTRHAAGVPGVREVVSHVLTIGDPRRTPPASTRPATPTGRTGPAGTPVQAGTTPAGTTPAGPARDGTVTVTPL